MDEGVLCIWGIHNERERKVKEKSESQQSCRRQSTLYNFNKGFRVSLSLALLKHAVANGNYAWTEGLFGGELPEASLTILQMVVNGRFSKAEQS